MTGETLYNDYRRERIRQGWQEWNWSSLTPPHRKVWIRLAERLAQQRRSPVRFPALSLKKS